MADQWLHEVPTTINPLSQVVFYTSCCPLTSFRLTFVYPSLMRAIYVIFSLIMKLHYLHSTLLLTYCHYGEMVWKRFSREHRSHPLSPHSTISQFIQNRSEIPLNVVGSKSI